MSRLPYHVEVRFPNLQPDNYAVISPPDMKYNCIAWAASVDDLRFWPGAVQGYRWPADIPQEETIEAFVRFYAINGYERCDGPGLEQGYEKIALFCDEDDVPQHAARQLASGQWTSKLGDLHDIVHDELCGVEGGYGYGRATVFMKRCRTSR